MYVCQSVSWLTSLLKLDKYRHISGPEWDIFLKIFGDIPGMLFHHFQIILNFLYVCQSVSWHTSLLKLDKYRDISSSGWVIFMKLFYTFLGCTVGWQADMGHFGLFQISMQGIYFLKIQVFCHTKLASFCSKMFSTPNDRLPKLATWAVFLDFGQKLA